MHICVRVGVLGACKYFVEPKPLYILANGEAGQSRAAACMLSYTATHKRIYLHTHSVFFFKQRNAYIAQ